MAEETKRKSYCCVVHLSKAVSLTRLDEVVSACNEAGGFVLKQKTPLRVLHRRTLLVREKRIHKMSIERINQNFVIVRLESQAGTYIKEFITGDMGRTQPSLGDLVGCEADIIQLDVEQVHMD